MELIRFADARAFLALPSSAPPSDPAALATGWVSQPAGGVYLWVVEGRVVSMAAARMPTPGGIRISAVYTPPDQRARGYASAVVAAASQHQLDSGRRACFLFTDRANPTSNHIYAVVGYEPVADVDRYRFMEPDTQMLQACTDP